MKYLVIGGNAAGMSFVAKMKRNQKDSEIVVIEKRDYVSLGGCGLPYYVGDYFENEDRLLARDVDSFLNMGVDLRINQEVIKVDEKSKTVVIKDNDKEYEETYDKLIISSGASPIIFNGVKVDNKKIFTLTSLEDGINFKKVLKENSNKKIGIIGAGFIGLELMDSILNYDHKVSVLTRDEDVLFPLFSKEILEDLTNDINNNKQIELINNINISTINNNQKVEVVTDKKTFEFDFLVLAMGFRPNTSFINLDKLANGAIITDFNSKTSVDDIYAIGDCATVKNAITNKNMYLPLATTANKLGRKLADDLSNIKTHFKGMLGSTSIKVLDYELARTGLMEKDCIDNNISFKTKFIKDVNQTSYYPGQSSIKAKIIYKEETLEVLGIEMIGKKGVVGRVDAMSVVILNKMTTKELGYIDFAYSPPFARTWDFLNVIGNVSK